MITISAACCFASHNTDTKKLTSSIIEIGEGTTIISNADSPALHGDVAFYGTRKDLIARLRVLTIKNDDGSEIIDTEL